MVTFYRLLNSRRFLIASTILLAVCLIFQAVWFLLTTATWLDEGIYLYKSTAHVGYGLKLYSLELPCWYTPLYFVVLGTWQEALGYGLLSGRTLSFLFFVGAMFFTALMARKLSPGRWTIPAFLGIVAITPSIAGVNCSITQFAFVNIQLALILWIMFASNEDRSRWIISGLLMGFLSMTRPNMLLMLPLLPVLYFWLRGWKGWRPVIELLVAWILVVAAITAVYGEGAFWNLVRAFPGAELLVNILGFNEHAAVANLKDLGLKVGDWWTNRESNKMGWHVYFLKGYLWPYLLILALNVFGIVKWYRDGKRPSMEAGFAFLFLWSSILHFIGIQSFCKNCAQGYMNYSIIPGLLGAISSLNHVVQSVRNQSLQRKWLAPALLALTVGWIGAAWIPAGPLIGPYSKWFGPHTGKTVMDLAVELDRKLPGDAHVLTLGAEIRMVEAVHLAGRTVEPLTINYFFSLREPIDPEKKFTTEEINRYRTSGMWTLDLMNTWLSEEHDYVLYQEGKFPRTDLIEKWYDIQPLFPTAGGSEFHSSLRLAVRKKKMSEENSLTLAP